MRPRKTVLLAAQHEERMAVLAFMLRVRGFHVDTADSAAEAGRVIRERHTAVDLLLILWPVDGGRELLALNSAADSETAALVVVYDQEEHAFGWTADAVLRYDHCSPAEILERVQFLTARKRGPKLRGL